MKIKKLSFACVLFLSVGTIYAQDLYAPSVNDGKTLDVILLNNSGHTLVFQSSTPGNLYSQCGVISAANNLPAGAYMIIRGVYRSDSGAGLSCKITFEDANNTNDQLYLEIFDPTYVYQGSREYKFYDGGTPISSDYAPAAYPSNNPWGLMDENISLILNHY